MNHTARHTKIEFGDFQTPLELADLVCQQLRAFGVSPKTIIEPTCGTGAFVEASARHFPNANKVIGIEVNDAYLAETRKRISSLPDYERIVLQQGNFFDFNWKNLLKSVKDPILVIGNFPWVTNSQQGMIGGANLPEKFNFQNRSGFDAMTGRSNFDISEWMLIQAGNWLQERKGHLAMLCKTAVARKFLHHLYTSHMSISHSALYRIDAQKYFGASVEACLLVCKFDGASHNYDYDVYEGLEAQKSQRVGHRGGIAIRDLDTFEKFRHLFGSSELKWRSGIKHDCAEVMELKKQNGVLVNGSGEVVDIEPDYVYPLLKGSDIANNRIKSTGRFVIVPQKTVGEPTSVIKHLAPKTWKYLEKHAEYLDNRKSRIYRDTPRFSVFGVGPYTFLPYKIAICGLYKSLDFRLVGELENKPVVFDDTVYFLSFDTEEEARKVLYTLLSPNVQDFFSSMIFWDEKRPIKTSILNRLHLQMPKTVEALRLFEHKPHE